MINYWNGLSTMARTSGHNAPSIFLAEAASNAENVGTTTSTRTSKRASGHRRKTILYLPDISNTAAAGARLQLSYREEQKTQ